MEKKGVPTITFCTEVFDALGQSEATALGVPSLPIVRLPRMFQIEIQPEAVVMDTAGKVVDEAAYILTQPREIIAEEYKGRYPLDKVEEGLSRPRPLFVLEPVKTRESVEEATDIFYRRGWTDGLPIVPPTRAAVQRMLAYTDRDPQEIVGVIAPRMGQATVEKIAINAVMAGCIPEYMPVLITAVQILAQPEFNVYALQGTTNPVAPLIVINGPIIKELSVNFSYNAFGQGWRSNATIGRAIRLMLMNIGGGTPGSVDKAIQGQPAKYSFCVAENEVETPWDPFHVERGFERNVSTVTMAGVASVQNFHQRDTRGTPDELLELMAEVMSYRGLNHFHYGGEPILALNPGHATVLARAGHTKDDVKRYLFEKARVPTSRFHPESLEGMFHRRPQVKELINETGIPLVDRWQDFIILVVGAWGVHDLFLPTFGRPVKTITKAITLGDGTPIKSVKDFRK